MKDNLMPSQNFPCMLAATLVDYTPDKNSVHFYTGL